MNDELMREVSKSLHGLFELTTRVDERLKVIEESQEKLDRRISGQLHDIEVEIKTIIKEMNVLDRRVYIVESITNNQEHKWKLVVGYMLQTAFIVIICYLLYLLKLSPPPIL